MVRSSFRQLMAANTTVSISDLKDPKWWLVEAFGGRATKSGAHVTADAAFSISAYYLGIAAISEDIAKLPLNVYRRLQPRGKELTPEHPVQQLLDQPNPEMDNFTVRETLQSFALGWGNGVADIERNGRGEPIALWPVHPSRVTVQREKLADGSTPLMYTFRMDDRQPNAVVRRFQSDVFHLKGLGGNGITGYTPIHIRRESLGLTMQAETAGAAFFGNGMVNAGVLEHPETMKGEVIDHLRKQFAEVYGGAENFGKPLVLEQGMTWKGVTINPVDAQFLETRSFQVEEMARWLRMPPQKLMHLVRTSGQQTGELDVAYLKETLLPWIVRWEQQANWKLLPSNERSTHLCKHVVKAILRADPKTQAQWYKTMFMVGGFSPNDILDHEDMNPYEGGDERFVPTNMARTADVAEGKFAKTNKNPSTGDTGTTQKPNGRPPKNEEALLPLFVDAAERCFRREVNAAERAFKRCGKDADFGDQARLEADRAFTKWLADFYVGQERYLCDAVEPLRVMALTSADINDEDPQVKAAHVATLDRQLVALVEGWTMEQVASSMRLLKEQWSTGANDPSVLMERVEPAAKALFDRLMKG